MIWFIYSIVVIVDLGGRWHDVFIRLRLLLILVLRQMERDEADFKDHSPDE